MKTLELTVTRIEYDDVCTIGKLFIDGKAFCWTLEDVVRPAGEKIYAQTAIPAGRYRVEDTYSPHFGHNVPQIMDVPNFSGVRIHGGNDKDDTEGCVLVGMHRTVDRIDTCAPALHEVYHAIREAIKAGKEVWLNIVDTPHGGNHAATI